MKITKTRLAPTPSGYLHIGNVLSFLITASLAKKHAAKILLRIDDLDQKRVQMEYIQDIFDTLDFLEIPYDEGPKSTKEFIQDYSQLNRLSIYKDYIHGLKEKKLIFACDCSRKTLLKNHSKRYYTGTCLHRDLPLGKKQTALRLVTDLSQTIYINQYTDTQKAHQLPDAMNFFMVQKKDAYPSYQLASMLDDIYFDVDFIVRGKDLWPSTIAQVYLSNQLKQQQTFNQTIFYHHQLIKEEGEKLSKSNGSYAIRQMIKAGVKKEGIYRMISNQLNLPHETTNLEEFSIQFLLLMNQSSKLGIVNSSPPFKAD
ncbi:glutamate--tRNA ligase family protein [Cyclobacterium sp. 1_MG-2023]|uniref:glutamate--tRNA ligase family protein n=1 Tax=Cyclobacterium sp. 1_MG-2023 TaxID=3062681 RepID=UPI0026E1FDA1|nr:glutamate--tRNA ligase family protein [Cyclobacterium sp. 1_MG-2023]MDO6436263.1 glutamate--tRNA ligase family protein [Cyclobacterium sp. 1_MG-2023]